MWHRNGQNLGLQVWEHQVTREGRREGAAVPAPKAMVVPCPSPGLPAGHLSPEHGQQGQHSTLKLGEAGCEHRPWLGKARRGDEDVNFRIY